MLVSDECGGVSVMVSVVMSGVIITIGLLRKCSLTLLLKTIQINHDNNNN